MENIRILVTASTFPKWQGDGSPRFVLDLTKAIQKSSHSECLILVPHSKGALVEENMEGVDVVRYRYIYPYGIQKISGSGIVAKLQREKKLLLLVPFFLCSQAISTFRIILKFKPDILLVHWLVPQGIVACIMKKIFPKIKIIMISHGGDIAFLQKNLFLKLLGKYIISFSSKVVAVSGFVKRRIMDMSNIDEKDVCIIPMGVDVDKFVGSICAENSSIVHSTKKIVFLGRLEKKKGVEFLLRAIPLILNRHPDATLDVLGEGSLSAELKQLCRKLKIEDRVKFFGAVDHSKLSELLSESSFFVVPSINLEDDTEGLPTVLLEAMAAKMPIVATDAGGITDIIENGVTGFLVRQRDPADLAEKIVYLMDAPHAGLEVSEKAFERLIGNFSYSVIGDKYREILKNCIDG